MRSRLNRRFDPNLITILLIVVIAALPFLTRPGLPRHTDLELHVLRAAEYGEVLRDGVLYPRWATDFYYGYGYPIFNYYAPLTYALANVFDLFPGVDVVAAMKFVILTTYALGAYGTYFFVRRHFGATAGIIASAAFVLSPYFLFIDPLMRGDVAEFLALGWLPWVFYVFDRPRRFSIAQPLVLAALIFSHNLLALIGAGLLALYLLWRGLLIDGVKRWTSDALSVGLAAGLTAIFWLPFIAERDQIRLNVAGSGHFDYHNHFIPLNMLLLPSPQLDMAATTPKYIYNLGLVQWLLLIPASVLAIWRRTEIEGKIALFFVLITLALIVLVTPASTFLWERFPGAALVQFPWRFLGPAAFTLAVAVSSLFRPVSDVLHTTPHTPRTLIPALALLALLISALPAMYPPLWQGDFGDTSPRGMIEFELSGVALGTTSTGDFLPKPIGREPGPTASLLDSYATGRIDKFDHTMLPEGATVQAEDHSAAYDRFRLETPSEFKGRLLTFLFPGWSVLIDGLPVPVTPQDQTGFIEFQIPAGAHVIEAVFSPTQPRSSGGLISFGALLAIVVLGVSRRRRPEHQAVPAPRPAFAWTLCAVSAAFLVGKIAVVDRCDACFRYTSPVGQALAAQHRQQASFGGHIELLGYDLSSVEVKAGHTLPLTLYWHAIAPVPHNYQVFAHLTQPDTVLWGQSDKLNPGDFPSTRWPLDKYVWDDHRLAVLPGTPPGEYRLSVGLYDLASGQRAPVLDEAGQIVGDHIVLNVPVRVTTPASPPAIETLGIQHPLDRVYRGSQLLGWSIESPIMSTPNFARLTLFWQGLAGSSAVNLRAALIDRAGEVVQTLESNVPALQRGEIRRDQIAFWLPPDFPAGVYHVRLSVVDDSGHVQDTVDITSIEVQK